MAVATVGGVGRAPLAPGTVASALTALALWLLAPTVLARGALALVVGLTGAWAAEEAERVLGVKDPGVIVVDEVAGMILAVLVVPLTPATLLAGFLLFRVFDVVKPFPANVCQRLPGGAGVMLDDLVAGLYALGLVVLGGRLQWL